MSYESDHERAVRHQHLWTWTDTCLHFRVVVDTSMYLVEWAIRVAIVAYAIVWVANRLGWPS